jgi:hypothetical protein
MEPVLDVALADFEWPGELHVAITQLGLRTVRDLVVLSPRALEGWLRSAAVVAETRVVLERALGLTWEVARAREILDDASAQPVQPDKPRYDPQKWELLREKLGARLRDVWLPDVFRAPHVRRLERVGLRTDGDLFENHSALFRSGWLTHDRLGRLARALETAPPDPLETTTWREALETSLATLHPKTRRVICARAGLAGAPLTFRRIGESLGVSSGRVKEIERHGIRKMRFGQWQSRIDERLVTVVGEDTLRAVDLGPRDAFFSVQRNEGSAFAWFVNQLVRGRVFASVIREKRGSSMARRKRNVDANQVEVSARREQEVG